MSNIMDMIGQMGQGQPPPETSPQPQPEGEGDVLGIIRQALDLVRQYAQQEQDDENTLRAEKISTLLAEILANEQKEIDQALQGKASPRVLRQAYAG